MKTIYPWQQSQWKYLLTQYQQGKLPHALILTGPQGLGKRDFAYLFANLVLCENAPNHVESNGEACGACRGCKLFSANNHPDFFQIGTEQDSKSIKIDQLRELIEQLNTTAQRSGYQIALIYPLEAMNLASANALLKTLEEPPGKVLFILISDQPGKLPATITSRCQRINFVGNEDEVTTAWLQEKINSASIDVSLLLRSADYAPLRALQLLESNYFEVRNVLLKHLQTTLQNPASIMSFSFNYEAQESLRLLQAWISLANDMVRLQLNADATSIVNVDCLELLKILSQKIAIISLQKFLMSLIEARFLLSATTNANIQLVIESLWVQWQNLKRGR